MSQTIRIVSGVNEGISFEVEEGQELKLGRSVNNDIVLPYDSCISGKHALIKLVNGVVSLCDLASTNGTFVAGERISHGVYYPIKDFFVIGSTIFSLTNCVDPCDFHPITAEEANSRGWSARTLFRTTLANHPKGAFLGCTHLFVNLIALYPKELAPFFTSLGFPIDGNLLKSRVLKHRIFEDRHEWLNRSLSLRARMRTEDAIYITPRVQALLESADPNKPEDPTAILIEMLKYDFNLIFPLLQWETYQKRWTALIEKLSGKAPQESPRVPIDFSLSKKDYGLSDLKSFWTRIEQAHAMKELLILTGSPGCGKTTALHLGFQEKGMNLLGSSFYEGPRTFLDPKAFLFFNAPSKLAGYAWRAGEMLDQGEFLVIDHFDEMLLAMQHENIDRGSLFRQLRKHRGPVVLCVNKENMELIDTHVGSFNILDMDEHLEPRLPNIHQSFLRGFENRIKGVLSPRAKRFFLDKVAAADPYNLGGIKEFLRLCAGRAQVIDPTFSELGQETRASGLLGEGCFKDVYNTWLNKSHGVSDGREEAVLEQLEKLFHEFARHLFNVHLRYSDQSRSFLEPGRLSRNQKLEELKSHMIYMFSSLQSGFSTWFQEFWMKLDPEIIRYESGDGSNPKKLWAEYCQRTRTLDADYAEDLFNQTLSRVFLEALRRKDPSVTDQMKPIQGDPKINTQEL